ncbi:glycoside hydrolase family 32 protein [Brachyspira murdochii]|uniref:Sucrose-6-phosphate hydrolase n=1 Tax=Brachyspira murdochii (strain ATCC 51284 / DSM 12563 / 56-150) TaxID=526224 RepID=D5U593_BRAM5|nr:glycoside hydrolase family 32 protein [Brachyspira murdochii]ADG70360.1 sucrose-6-phosphate hydrolase [Brachyspira murdochii DSM 12563]
MNLVSKIFKEAIIKKENEYLAKNNKDKWRLNFHIMPPVGWLNDPNGLSYFKGIYNIFFQYSPFETEGGLKFWGHYQTKDLINYKYVGVSIYPDEKYDCHGVYSGSAFIEDDKLYIYYTGNVKLLGIHDYIESGREANTMLTVTEDGINFSEKECLMEMKDYPKDITNHIRDPKVWKENDSYYMVQGARKYGIDRNNDIGEVLLFSSKDKRKWTHTSTIHTKDIFGYMWECPDLFNLDGQDILITCPQGVKQVESIYENLYLSGYFLINDDYKNKESIEVNNFTILDRGFDFYAPQTFLDENGNRVIIGWMGVPDTEDIHKNLTVDYGWQHCLTIPRELSFKNGKLYQKPHRNLEKLREKKIFENKYSNNTLSDNLIYNDISSYEVIIDNIKIDNNINSFEIIISEGLCAKYKDNKFILEFIGDTGKTIGGGRNKRSSYLENLKNIRIMADTSSLELFINDGELAFTTRYYPLEYSFKILGEMNITIYKLSGFNFNP